MVPRPPPSRVATTGAPPWRKAVVGAVIGLAGAAVGFGFARIAPAVLPPLGDQPLLKVSIVLLLPVLWLVVVGLHELGHLVGGWLIGGRFLIWVVGPLKIQRTPIGIRAQLNASVNLMGGMAGCLPADPRTLTPRRTAVMILGGPVFSAALTAVGLGGFAWLVAAPAETIGPGQAWAAHLMLATAALSLLIFVATAVPFTAGGFKSDGRRVLDLLRGDARSRQEHALVVLSLALLSGERPARFDRGLIDAALSLRDGSLFDLYAHLTVYTVAADRGEWAQAQRHLDTALAGEGRLVPFSRDIARAEYAWLTATATGDAATARAWLDSVGRLDFDPATRLRAEAAVLLAEGRTAEAARVAQAGLEALRRRSLSPVPNPFALDALQVIIDRATRPAT